MSTPPFIAIPDGVEVFAPPAAPAPVLVAEAVPDVTAVAHGTEVVDGAQDAADGGAAPAPAPPGAEPPTARGDVLLVPGFTGSKEDFIALLVPLARRGWRVAAMDLPGQGSFAGLGPRGSHTAAILATTVRAVAEWFAPGRRVHLVGHSMGGLVTREVVLDSPESLASWIPMCSGPGAIPAEAHASLLQLQAALEALPMDQIWLRKEAADRAGGWDPPSQEVADFCARRFIANDPAALADFADILMHAPDTTDDVAECLDEFGLFATVVTGALDDAWPIAQQGQMAERLGVPWRVLPGIGHNPATEDPEATADALDSVFATASA